MALKHRVSMAPLTRFRASESHVHQDVAVEYYTQRCGTPGTLIITEATFIHDASAGYPNVPSIFTPDQIAAWKRIVDAVHAKDCFIVMQLWALGRAAVGAVLQKEGTKSGVVSSSNIALEGSAEVVRALSVEEIAEYNVAYGVAAKAFVEGAGGDGVELHAGNGYLIDQFTQTNSNKRTDNYGGSAENRCRFALEAMDSLVKAVGPEKVGIRLSPFSTFQDMKMPTADIMETFGHIVSTLKTTYPTLAYIHAVEARIAGNADITPPVGETLDFLYDMWTNHSPKNVFLIAGGFNADNGRTEAEKKPQAVVVYGRFFISNPDLPARIKHNIAFVPYDRSTFYLYGPDQIEGYTTYGNAPILAKA